MSSTTTPLTPTVVHTSTAVPLKTTTVPSSGAVLSVTTVITPECIKMSPEVRSIVPAGHSTHFTVVVVATGVAALTVVV